MWICFNDAFVSVVRHRTDENLFVVRGRNPEHLRNVFPGHAVIMSPKGDYCARVFITQTEFQKILSDRVKAIDYDNFKNSVGDEELHDVYLDIWSRLYEYQLDVTTK